MIEQARAIVTALGGLAVEGTVIALAAWVLARRSTVRPAWQAAVWLVVVAKFALPWSPSLPWSIADLLARLRGDEVAPAILWSAPVPEGASTAAAPSVVWLVVLAVWIAGSTLVLVRGLRASHRATVAARRAPDAPAAVRALVLPRGRVRVAVGAHVAGPHVVGLWRPTIVVPPALLAQDPALVRAALLHELAHVRRFDLVGRLLQLAATALFWWLPVVHLANRQLERARESACDAWALEGSALPAPAYARLLVQMAQLAAPRGAPALAREALDARVASVLAAPLRARLTRGHQVALALWIALALGGARATEAAAAPDVTCVYTVELAQTLRQAHPEADLDGDGVLSHDEACDLQAELAAAHQRLQLAEPLCCNCDAALGASSPATPDQTCTAQEE